MRIGYVVDFRTYCLVLVERHPAHPARIPASGFRLFCPLQNDYVIDLRTVKRFGFRLKRRKWDKLLLHFASAVELTNGL